MGTSSITLTKTKEARKRRENPARLSSLTGRTGHTGFSRTRRSDGDGTRGNRAAARRICTRRRAAQEAKMAKMSLRDRRQILLPALPGRRILCLFRRAWWPTVMPLNRAHTLDRPPHRLREHLHRQATGSGSLSNTTPKHRHGSRPHSPTSDSLFLHHR